MLLGVDLEAPLVAITDSGFVVVLDVSVGVVAVGAVVDVAGCEFGCVVVVVVGFAVLLFDDEALDEDDDGVELEDVLDGGGVELVDPEPDPEGGEELGGLLGGGVGALTVMVPEPFMQPLLGQVP